jgi:hypothetical protein
MRRGNRSSNLPQSTRCGRIPTGQLAEGTCQSRISGLDNINSGEAITDSEGKAKVLLRDYFGALNRDFVTS